MGEGGVRHLGKIPNKSRFFLDVAPYILGCKNMIETRPKLFNNYSHQLYLANIEHCIRFDPSVLLLKWFKTSSISESISNSLSCLLQFSYRFPFVFNFVLLSFCESVAGGRQEGVTPLPWESGLTQLLAK